MKKSPKIRCAIYTRKSTEEGLEQEFNSLDAQRAAAEAYIQSQVHEGWELIPTYYDDGGFSGGNMARPALNALLADIEAKKIDVVVVYKVDRLSRALSDFARMVELFDKHEVSFVSVTQQFNTTTSMGRLTLNVLLSFAQFEREVTGERIRDKFAASKKKGLWMGGPLSLGYDLVNRKLLVNQEEAELVNLIFKKYLELKSIRATNDYLNEQGYKNKIWTNQKGKISGGKSFTKSSIKSILSNQLYIGKMKHKGEAYEGEQGALVENSLWQEVQGRLKNNSAERESKTNQNHNTLFKGKIYDADGNLFTTTHTKRGSKRYHYYLNKISKCRISVAELNAIIANSLNDLDPNNLNLEINSLTGAEIQNRYNVEKVTMRAVEKIVIADTQISIFLNKRHLIETIDEFANDADADSENPETIEVIANITFRSSAGRKIAYSANGNVINLNRSNHNEALIKAITRSYKWNKLLDSGEVNSAKEIAEKEKLERTYVGDVMRLKYLAPEITTMILKGLQPRDLNVSQLVRQQLPVCWNEQKKLLNII